DNQFTEALKSQGFAIDSYRKSLRKQILELKVVSQAVRSRVSVGDEEVRTYCKQNEKAMSGDDRQVRLRQILIGMNDKMSDDEIEKKKRVAMKVVELARE